MANPLANFIADTKIGVALRDKLADTVLPVPKHEHTVHVVR